jgi:hypothetical protein
MTDHLISTALTQSLSVRSQGLTAMGTPICARSDNRVGTRRGV